MGHYNKKDPLRRIWLALVYGVHLILGLVLQLGGPLLYYNENIIMSSVCP